MLDTSYFFATEWSEMFSQKMKEQGRFPEMRSKTERGWTSTSIEAEEFVSDSIESPETNDGDSLDTYRFELSILNRGHVILQRLVMPYRNYYLVKAGDQQKILSYNGKDSISATPRTSLPIVSLVNTTKTYIAAICAKGKIQYIDRNFRQPTRYGAITLNKKSSIIKAIKGPFYSILLLIEHARENKSPIFLLGLWVQMFEQPGKMKHLYIHETELVDVVLIRSNLVLLLDKEGALCLFRMTDKKKITLALDERKQNFDVASISISYDEDEKKFFLTCHEPIDLEFEEKSTRYDLTALINKFDKYAAGPVIQISPVDSTAVSAYRM